MARPDDGTVPEQLCRSFSSSFGFHRPPRSSSKNGLRAILRRKFPRVSLHCTLLTFLTQVPAAQNEDYLFCFYIHALPTIHSHGPAHLGGRLRSSKHEAVPGEFPCTVLQSGCLYDGTKEVVWICPVKDTGLAVSCMKWLVSDHETPL